MAIDLHVHSKVSDGEYTPEELVSMAKKAGLTAIAVCDHDTIEGSRRAMAAGAKAGFTVVPGVEVSASLDGEVVHILGYGIDLDDAQLASTLHEAVEYRLERAKSIIASINKELVAEEKSPIDVQEVLDLGKEKPLTRIDIAVYLVNQGYVKTRAEAFDTWLEKYNVPNKSLSALEAIKLIHNAGGIAILAHPNSPSLSLNTITQDFEKQKDIIRDLQTHGLDGIESIRFKQSPDDEKKFTDFAQSAGLLVTGGSDFHGPGYEGSAHVVGAKQVPDSVAANVMDAIAARRAKNPA